MRSGRWVQACTPLGAPSYQRVAHPRLAADSNVGKDRGGTSTPHGTTPILAAEGWGGGTAGPNNEPKDGGGKGTAASAGDSPSSAAHASGAATHAACATQASLNRQVTLAKRVLQVAIDRQQALDGPRAPRSVTLAGAAWFKGVMTKCRNPHLPSAAPEHDRASRAPSPLAAARPAGIADAGPDTRCLIVHTGSRGIGTRDPGRAEGYIASRMTSRMQLDEVEHPIIMACGGAPEDEPHTTHPANIAASGAAEEGPAPAVTATEPTATLWWDPHAGHHSEFAWMDPDDVAYDPLSDVRDQEEVARRATRALQHTLARRRTAYSLTDAVCVRVTPEAMQHSIELIANGGEQFYLVVHVIVVPDTLCSVLSATALAGIGYRAVEGVSGISLHHPGAQPVQLRMDRYTPMGYLDVVLQPGDQRDARTVEPRGSVRPYAERRAYYPMAYSTTATVSTLVAAHRGILRHEEPYEGPRMSSGIQPLAWGYYVLELPTGRIGVAASIPGQRTRQERIRQPASALTDKQGAACRPVRVMCGAVLDV